MSKYFYKVKINPTESKEGIIEAENRSQASIKLQEQGYFPIVIQDVSSADKTKTREGLFGRVNLFELSIFTRQLASLLESGLTLMASLNTINKQTQNKILKDATEKVAEDVREGGSFSGALARYPKIFSVLYVSLVRAGELGGSLNTVLERLADFSEKEEETRSKVHSALVYPALILVVGFVTVFVLLSFVIPRLVGMFEDMGQALPLPTLILIKTSGFFKSFWWLILSAVAIFIFVLRRMMNNPNERERIDSAILKIPVAGLLVVKVQVARFARTLSMLLSNGVSILPALEVTKETITNQIIKGQVEDFEKKIRDGWSLSKSIRESSYFPGFVADIVATGEESGTIEKSLSRIANSYEREVDRLIKTATTLLEPTMILIMGLIIGFIVMSILLPIFQINLIMK